MELDSVDCCLLAMDSESVTPGQSAPWQGVQDRLTLPEESHGRCIGHWQERIFCAVCQQFLEEPCWFHAKSVPNESVVPFALASLPKILRLDVCADSSTGKKVLANVRIPPQTVFGPLVAPLAEKSSDAYVCAFPSADDGQLRFFQLDSELFSNWMRYVRFTENPAEKNLAVYLRGSQIVFVSVRTILPGEELRVCYSAKYSRAIGCTNVQSAKQENESFCVTDMEYGDHNENALPPTYPQNLMETGSHVDTFEWDGDSSGTQMIENNASGLRDVLVSPHIRPAKSLAAHSLKRVGGVNGRFLASTSACAIPPSPHYEAADLGMDDGGSASPPPPSGSRDAPPVTARTMREDSPEIEYRPPFGTVQVPTERRNKEELEINAETVSRRSTLRSAARETVTLSQRDGCDQIVETVSHRIKDKPIRETNVVRMEPSCLNGASSGNGDLEVTESPDGQSCAFRARRKNLYDGGIRMECPVCHIAVFQLRVHLSQEHPEYASEEFKHACQTCGMRYRTMRRLRVHISMFHSVCGAEITAESHQEAIEYMRETGSLSYFCAGCNKYFVNKSLWAIHELSHRAVEDYQARAERTCPVCDFTGATFAELALHTADHAISPKDRKQCLLCPLQIVQLSAHYKKYHPEYRELVSKDWQFECQQCRVKYLSKIHLDAHLRTHSNYKCVYCALQFDTGNALRVHNLTHQKDGVFPCPMCPRTFPLYRPFRKHYRKNHDVKNVSVCEVCQFVCKNKVRLKLHMQSHNQDYRYACTQCGKRCKAERYLRNHVRRVHEGKHMESEKNKYSKRKEKEKQGLLKPYADPRRKFPFEGFPFKCHECKRGYLLRRSLMDHVRERHPELDPQSVPVMMFAEE
ncbi:PR domain zinc finger protein 15-like isoform X2 [Paramacrobiotus metropolitanus]|uniref:PR domain zinc finger protein 15-like isoform X2 n=1 Tax=Paramacrobiotus metropolitanus TaxID=2943436 RepID=UPI0024463A4D|nr:PR domain zinc finger protein 15-like isoform X2 [Paramacrobiotus metropolitanus]